MLIRCDSSQVAQAGDREGAGRNRGFISKVLDNNCCSHCRNHAPCHRVDLRAPQRQPLVGSYGLNDAPLVTGHHHPESIAFPPLRGRCYRIYKFQPVNSSSKIPNLVKETASVLLNSSTQANTKVQKCTKSHTA